MSRLLLRGGRLLDPSQGLDRTGDLLVENGVVAHCGDRLESVEGAEVLDCAGTIVAPGFIDVHCHLREPGREDVQRRRPRARPRRESRRRPACSDEDLSGKTAGVRELARGNGAPSRQLHAGERQRALARHHHDAVRPRGHDGAGHGSR